MRLKIHRLPNRHVAKRSIQSCCAGVHYIKDNDGGFVLGENIFEYVRDKAIDCPRSPLGQLYRKARRMALKFWVARSAPPFPRNTVPILAPMYNPMTPAQTNIAFELVPFTVTVDPLNVPDAMTPTLP